MAHPPAIKGRSLEEIKGFSRVWGDSSLPTRVACLRFVFDMLRKDHPYNSTIKKEILRIMPLRMTKKWGNPCI